MGRASGRFQRRRRERNRGRGTSPQVGESCGCQRLEDELVGCLLVSHDLRPPAPVDCRKAMPWTLNADEDLLLTEQVARLVASDVNCQRILTDLYPRVRL